jgi:hypothetical protein
MSKPTTIAAVVLSCTATAFAQSPAERSLNENYTYYTTPRYQPYMVKRMDPVYEPSYKNIKPPLEDVKVSSVNKAIDNKEGAKLSYSSGTTIHIPPGAFVDENGKPVEGNVTVSYREFKNPLDFLLSGIPMGADSAGVKGQFVSAGMFEMNASVNGKQVFLKKGSKIDVQMSSMDKNPDYNLYAFNDASGIWEMKTNKNNIPVSVTPPYVYSEAVRRYMDFVSMNRYSGYDSTTCRERFESAKYFYTQRNEEKNIDQARWWWKGKSYRSLVKITAIHKTKDGGASFQISNATSGTHRELYPYQNINWKLNEKMDYKEFRQFVSNKNNFSDIRIEQDGDEYRIRLKGMSGFKEIKAVPVILGEGNTASSYSDKTKNKLYVKYSKIMKWREKYFDHRLVRGKIEQNYVVIRPEEMPLYGWKFVQASMTPEEKILSLEQWADYVSDQKEAEVVSINTVAANSSNIMRSFSVDGMGVWNCDQIKRLSNPVQVAASYVNEEGKPIEASSTYIIDKNLNGVLQYYGSDEIAFSKTAETILIAIKSNGEIAVAFPEYFQGKKFSNHRPYTFTLKELSAGTTSVQELKKMMGL